MSGVGKSTVLAELAKRGHPVLDTDDDGWTLRDATWDPVRMTQYLRAHASAAVSGTVENQARFYEWFSAVSMRAGRSMSWPTRSSVSFTRRPPEGRMSPCPTRTNAPACG
jgi:hypothetical protein